MPRDRGPSKSEARLPQKKRENGCFLFFFFCCCWWCCFPFVIAPSSSSSSSSSSLAVWHRSCASLHESLCLTPANSLSIAFTSLSSAPALHSGATKNCAKRDRAPGRACGFASK